MDRTVQLLTDMWNRLQNECNDVVTEENHDALKKAIQALEQKPYEKFESTKDHIYKLAGDYKCWDNRLTEDEAVELCHILEQQPCDKYIKEIDHLRKYIYKLETQIVEQQPCDTRQAVIVMCKDCRKHNVSVGYQNDCCPLYEFRGISYGHEHDYQFCCYAERRTDE